MLPRIPISNAYNYLTLLITSWHRKVHTFSCVQIFPVLIFFPGWLSWQKCVLITVGQLADAYSLSDDNAEIKALDCRKINSKPVCDCHQSLLKLTERNRVQLIWVPGHGLKEELAHPFTEHEPACGVSEGTANRAVRDRCAENTENTASQVHSRPKTSKGFPFWTLCKYAWLLNY
jgi:hypothetical protein